MGLIGFPTGYRVVGFTLVAAGVAICTFVVLAVDRRETPDRVFVAPSFGASHAVKSAGKHVNSR